MNNTYKRITELLFEGETTGGEDTADRLGKWYKSINPKAKPGQKGYMRKRNVPKEGGEYEHPHHKEYAHTGIHSVGLKVASRQVPKPPKKGNIKKIHKGQADALKSKRKKFQDTLSKHGVPPWGKS